MALIKCKECGKEISDKASYCIHCGCPISDNIKEENIKNDNDSFSLNDEKIIAKTIIDEIRINKIRKLFLILVSIISIIIVLIIMSISKKTIYTYTNYWDYQLPKYEEVFDYGFFFAISLSYLIPISIIVILTLIKFNKYKMNYLILTKKRIKGIVNGIFSETTIDIPINKVNTILSTKTFYQVYGISISSSFYRTYHLNFILNSNDFREKTMELLNSIKE